MLLKADTIANSLAGAAKSSDPLVIAPCPDLEDLRTSGSGAVDLRLGTWVASLRRARMAYLDTEENVESRVLKHHFIPLGSEYYLHPGTFALGATLEWLRLPADLGGYVLGRSSWGRRGLVIATAVGVHPGFVGCLTLEISNLGELPLVLRPGMRICQLFLHKVDSSEPQKDHSRFLGQRRPALGAVNADDTAKRLFQQRKPG
jgi:dCTP deaminase